MTDEEFAAKIGWEGGIVSALEYGLRASDLTDHDSELFAAWRLMEEAWRSIQAPLRRVEALLPDEDW